MSEVAKKQEAGALATNLFEADAHARYSEYVAR